tara:strand:+ start:48 stop:305 length:258 start_codon:yes stop_codon:yes gene_type:complete
MEATVNTHIVAVFDDGFRYHWDEARNLWTDGDVVFTGCRNGISLANFALNNLPPNCCIYHYGRLVNVQNFTNEARLWRLRMVEGI